MSHRIRRIDGSYGVMIPGPGVPGGGAEHQVLRKHSDRDYDTEWHTLDTYTQAEIDSMIDGVNVFTDGDHGDVMVSSGGTSLMVESAHPPDGIFAISSPAETIALVQSGAADIPRLILQRGNSSADQARISWDGSIFYLTSAVNRDMRLSAKSMLLQSSMAVPFITFGPTVNTSALKFYVPDQVYSGLWNGDLSVPTKNAIYDQIELLAATIPAEAEISDNAYSASWDTATGVAPSQNAVYDKIESVVASIPPAAPIEISDTIYGPSWNGVANLGPSQNAVYDKIETVIALIPAAPSTVISDTVYGPSWDSVTGIAPSKNAVYDKITALEGLVIGAMIYKGTWNATTNSPAIPAAAAGNKGWYYIVNVAGTTSINGIAEWKIGDWLVSNGAAWDKIDNTDSVSTVNGQTGIVVITKGDVGLGNVDNTSDANKPVSTAQQTAIDAKVSDAAYGAGWDGITGVAPSKNAVYDKIQAITAAGSPLTDGDKGDVVVSATGSTFTVESAAGAFVAAGLITGAGIKSSNGIFYRGDGANIMYGAAGGPTYYYSGGNGGYVWGNSANSIQTMQLDNSGNQSLTGGIIARGGSFYFGPQAGDTAADCFVTIRSTNYYSALQFQSASGSGGAMVNIGTIYGGGLLRFPSFNFNNTAGDVHFATLDANGMDVVGRVVSNSVVIRGDASEGGQLVLGYKGTTAIVGAVNSTWNIDVTGLDQFRIYNISASGTVGTPFYIDPATLVANFTVAPTVSGVPVATTGQLANYLPLAGGNVTGLTTFLAAGTSVAPAHTLQVFAPDGGTPALMGFHRSGALATYIGLDTDNTFTIGGWSWGNLFKINAGQANVFPPTLVVGPAGQTITIMADPAESKISYSIAPNSYQYCTASKWGYYRAGGGHFQFDHATGAMLASGNIFAQNDRRVFQHGSNAFPGAEIWFATAAPSGGNDGDIWLQYV